MEYFTDNIAIAWLVIGSIFIIVDLALIFSIILFLAGIAAITLGAILTFITFETAPTLILQLTYFLGLFCLWTAILWKPLKYLQNKKGKNSYNNIINKTAIIESDPLLKGDTGEVKFSGTLMNARIAPDSQLDKFEKNTNVKIVDFEGTTLIIDEIKKGE